MNRQRRRRFKINSRVLDCVPCDRKFVESSINEWYGVTGPEGQDVNGLDHYNQVVRTELRTSVDVLLRKESILPLQLLVVFGSFLIWASICDLSFQIRDGRVHCSDCLIWDIFTILAVFPILALFDGISGFTLFVLHRYEMRGSRLSIAVLLGMNLLTVKFVNLSEILKGKYAATFKTYSLVGLYVSAVFFRWVAQ